MSPALFTIQNDMWILYNFVMFNHGMSWHLQRPARPVRRFLDSLVSARDTGIHPISPSLLEALSLAWQSQICEAMAQPGHSHSMSVTQVENQQKSPESDLVKQEKSDSWKVKSSEYV